ncbi:MAG: DNA alkylation repair protein [Exilispira sp.]|jgi:3-methyladenine DNA glycosylase AlkD|nr:DNA alkylation repair protein [Exilispira sp.]
MSLIKEIKSQINSFSDLEKAKILSKYFQAFPGGYGENDTFLGISVPTLRKIATKYYKACDLNIVSELLSSGIHEYRNVALMILIKLNLEPSVKADFYLQNIDYINNWDLIDGTAPDILGTYLYSLDEENQKQILLPLIISSNIWHKRIAMMSTFYFIKKNEFNLTLKVAKLLLEEKHQIVQKSVGWMLREIGKRHYDLELDFLKNNIENIYPIAFSYAIEKFSLESKESIKNLRNNSIKKTN